MVLLVLWFVGASLASRSEIRQSVPPTNSQTPTTPWRLRGATRRMGVDLVHI